MKHDDALVSEALRYGLACFYLDGALFSVNIRLVREINPHMDITPARRAPSFVRGLVNLRGQIVTVIDLGDLLGLGDRPVQASSRLVILKTDAELAALEGCELSTCHDKVGLLVDRISDVVTPTPEQLESRPPNLDGLGADLLAGVCKTEGGAVGILDVRRLLEMAGASRERRSNAA